MEFVRPPKSNKKKLSERSSVTKNGDAMDIQDEGTPLNRTPQVSGGKFMFTNQNPTFTNPLFDQSREEARPNPPQQQHQDHEKPQFNSNLDAIEYYLRRSEEKAKKERPDLQNEASTNLNQARGQKENDQDPSSSSPLISQEEAIRRILEASGIKTTSKSQSAMEEEPPNINTTMQSLNETMEPYLTTRNATSTDYNRYLEKLLWKEESDYDSLFWDDEKDLVDDLSGSETGADPERIESHQPEVAEPNFKLNAPAKKNKFKVSKHPSSQISRQEVVEKPKKVLPKTRTNKPPPDVIQLDDEGEEVVQEKKELLPNKTLKKSVDKLARKLPQKKDGSYEELRAHKEWATIVYNRIFRRFKEKSLVDIRVLLYDLSCVGSASKRSDFENTFLKYLAEYTSMFKFTINWGVEQEIAFFNSYRKKVTIESETISRNEETWKKIGYIGSISVRGNFDFQTSEKGTISSKTLCDEVWDKQTELIESSDVWQFYFEKFGTD